MGHHHNINAKEFVVGAAVGSLLGSVAALLIAPKAGRKLRQDICDAYYNISDKTCDLAERGKCLAKNVGCQTSNWACKAKSAVDGAKKSVKGWISDEEEEENSRDLLIGGLVGSVLGAAAGLLLAPKPGEELRQDIVDTYEDVSDKTQEFAHDINKKGKAFAKTARTRANKWLDIAHQLVDDLTDNAQETGEDLFEKAKGLVHNNHIHDAIDWASVGFRLWQGLKSKR
jgi:gas vesicle protein